MDHKWKNQAACRTKPHHWWIPAIGANDQPLPYDPRASAYCGVCPVQAECLNHECGFPNSYGMFANTGPVEREWLRGKKLRAGHEYDETCSCDYCASLDVILSGARPDMVSDGRTHGLLATYRLGCRCLACCHASANKDAERRLSGKPTPDGVVLLRRRRRVGCVHDAVSACVACQHVALAA